ncbi:HEPN domain-containing protein [Candidatus Aerophobetes bacterium]|nr:HEPN domain-containing protein [Candidatus Aerophobetes bacterium]
MKNRKRILSNYRIEQAERAIKDTEILLNEGGSPGSIINRAYYAMFYAVLALLVKIEIGTSKHRGAIALFDQHFVKEGIFPKDMSYALHKGFDIRQMSDYRELVKISNEDVREIFQKAKDFVKKVREYLSK